VILREAPTPEIAPVITCVELTGIPAAAVPIRVIAAEVRTARAVGASAKSRACWFLPPGNLGESDRLYPKGLERRN
jgi:hypothetical protein